jgi:hypothetical protein
MLGMPSIEWSNCLLVQTRSIMRFLLIINFILKRSPLHKFLCIEHFMGIESKGVMMGLSLNLSSIRWEHT